VYPRVDHPKPIASPEVVTARHARGRRLPESVAWEQARPVGHTSPSSKGPHMFLLWILAVILVIAGIVTALRGAVLYGIALIILGLLVGPGGVSVFN
jgi:hypothetical protein